MAAPISVPPPGFDDMPIDQQIDYVQALWQRIARHPERVPSPAWHLELLERRRAELEASGDRGRPWEEVREELHARLRAAKK